MKVFGCMIILSRGIEVLETSILKKALKRQRILMEHLDHSHHHPLIQRKQRKKETKKQTSQTLLLVGIKAVTVKTITTNQANHRLLK